MVSVTLWAGVWVFYFEQAWGITAFGMDVFQGGRYLRNTVEARDVLSDIRHICHTLDICRRCGYASCSWMGDQGRRTCDGAAKRTTLLPDQMSEWMRAPMVCFAGGQPFLTTSMRLRNKTVVYVKGLKAATPDGVGGGAELRRAVRAAATRFVLPGTEDYFEVVISMEPGTKQPKDFGLIMMGSVEAAQHFVEAAIAKTNGARGQWGSIKVCRDYVGVCLHNMFMQQDSVPKAAVVIPRPVQELHLHFGDVSQLSGEGGSASSTKRLCSIARQQLDVSGKQSQLADEAAQHDVPALSRNARVVEPPTTLKPPSRRPYKDDSDCRKWFPFDLVKTRGQE